MLVVISIISILLSILLPSLRSAKQQAESVKCKSNLKSIGVAINLYTQDYRERLAPYWDGLFFIDGESYTSPLDGNILTEKVIPALWMVTPSVTSVDFIYTPVGCQLALISIMKGYAIMTDSFESI
jgi:type II secretory pathway pseudopilin PulG